MTSVSVRSGRPQARKGAAPRKSGAIQGRYTKTTANVIGVGVLVVMLFPIYWAIATSSRSTRFKSRPESRNACQAA